MDFGAILDKWERQGGGAVAPGGGMPGAMAPGGIPAEAWGKPLSLPIRARGADKGAGEKSRRASAQEKRRRLMGKKPDAQIDIHGKTGEEAWAALDAFFADSREKSREKVMVIHGKGNHSKGEAVLKRVVMDFIERCPFAGESGKGKASAGGEGVTWVLLKEAARDQA